MLPWLTVCENPPRPVKQVNKGIARQSSQIGQSSWKAQALDGASDSEDSSDIEEAGNETNTRMADGERRSKLADFWYLLANDEGCLRQRFLREFNELPESSTDIRRCCSQLQPPTNLALALWTSTTYIMNVALAWQPDRKECLHTWQLGVNVSSRTSFQIHHSGP